MNIKILILAIGAAALGGCSTAYQAAQTPDDVYYSPAKPAAEYMAANDNADEYSSRNDRYSQRNDDRYVPEEDYDTYRNDRWLRMSIGNPYYLSTFNDYYWNDWNYPGFSFNLGFNAWNYGYFNYINSPWAGPFYWNSFYNPYAYNYIIINNPKNPIYNTPAARPTVFNPRAYNNTQVNSTNTRNYYNPRTGTYSNYNNTNTINTTGNPRGTTPGRYYNTNTGRGSDSRTYRSNNSSDRPARTYSPSGNNSSSGNTNNKDKEIKRPTR